MREEKPRVRRGVARPADFFAIKGTRRVSRGEGLRQTREQRAARAQTRRRVVCLDERGGLAAGKISCGGRKGNPGRAAEDFTTSLRRATAGLSSEPGRAGAFENGLAARAVESGATSAPSSA